MIARAIVAPKDCVLAVSFPMNEVEFDNDTKDLNKEYAKKFEGGWQQYETVFLRVLNKLVCESADVGIDVRVRFTSTDLRGVFERQPPPKVLVTVAHHNDSAGLVEFFDGMTSDAEFADCFPENASAVVDLATCFNEPLKAMIDRKHTGLLVCGFLEDVSPPLFLPIYGEIFKQIARCPNTYLAYYDAIMTAVFSKLNKINLSKRGTEGFT